MNAARNIALVGAKRRNYREDRKTNVIAGRDLDVRPADAFI